MRQYIGHGSEHAAKVAREAITDRHSLDYQSNVTVTQGYSDRYGHFIDIIQNCDADHRIKPRLNLV